MRLLIVEDEERLASSLKRGLEAEGFAVDVASNGTDGLWMAVENTYDAMVLDIMLPGLNGFEVCAKLRQAKVWTPILMLTAKDGELDEVEALDTGADDYLTKPFAHAVLVAHLRALLRRGSQARPARLEAGDVDALTAGVLAEDLRLQHLVDDLLLLARLDEGRRELPVAVDLDDLVFEEGRRARGAPPIEIDVSHVSAGQVLGDPRELRAVVRNLLDNAARHAHSTVCVTLVSANGRVVLTVEDDGDGIAPEDREAVFERFARLDASCSRDQGGHGLGLAIVRGVVNSHGGTVAAGQAGLGGASFVVDLPAHG